MCIGCRLFSWALFVSGLESLAITFFCVAVELSGLQLQNSDLVLYMKFWVPGADRIVEVEGVVIWCNQAGNRLNELYPPGMGVMFLGLPREEAAVLNEYVRIRSTSPLR